MKYVIDMLDDAALDGDAAGRKFAALASAFRAGFAVPEARVIRTEAHKRYLFEQKWPESLSGQVFSSADAIGLSGGLSIRSSAVNEDLENQSFAGQYRTFLRVADRKDLSSKIEKCWQSAASDAVQSYMGRGGPRFENNGASLLGVILQKMIYPVASGVAFGVNPLHPARDEIVIEAVEGLAERLVAGGVSPFRAVIDAGGRLTVTPPGGAVASDDAASSLLPREKWREIGRLVRDLEAHFNKGPLDVEWAVDQHQRLWLIQARPVTAAAAVQTDIPAGAWTRRIADDLWADRLTPFMADVMIKNAPRFNLSRYADMIGMNAVDPTLTAINGFLYINCDSLAESLRLIPERLRTEDIRRLFPPDYAFDRVPAASWPALLSTAVKSFRILRADIRANPLGCLIQARRDITTVHARLARLEARDAATAEEALDVVRDALAVFGRIQENNQFPYFFATLSAWVMRWVVADLAGFSHGDFLTMISKKGRNVSIDIERAFKRLAGKIRRDPALAAVFAVHAPDEAYDVLPSRFKTEVDAFLARYGCRARHRTLYEKRWAEAPEKVMGVLKSLLDNGPAGPGPAETTAAPAAWKKKALKFCLHPLLKMTMAFLDLREDLRFLLDRALYDLRKGLLTLGRLTGLGEDALFLTMDELRAVAEGGAPSEPAEKLAAARHREFLEPAPAATYYVDGRPMADTSSDGAVLTGVGVSPGRATGTARIVADPVNAHVRQGDILVARHTDPGWTPILSAVGGMVMEEGGLLNHCAIVARELGIPTVVGVPGAMRVIPEGARITVDGGAGIVTIEDDAATSTAAASGDV